MGDISYRPATMGDAAAIAGLLRVRDKEFSGIETTHDAESIRGELEGSGFDLGDSSRVAVAPDGTVIGFEIVYDHISPLRAAIFGHLHPDWRGRGVASELLRWTIDRGSRNVAKAPPDAQVSMITAIFPQDEAGVNLLAGHGFGYVRSSYVMRLDFDTTARTARLPDGFRLVSFAAQPELRPYLEVIHEAFSDHWGHVETPIEDDLVRWQEFIDTEPVFDPNYWWLAYHEDELAGGIMTLTGCGLGDDVAWISTLGVRQAYRRQGLGSALLNHAIAAYQARGNSGVALDVDASSLTNAVALYERAGMRVFSRRDLYEKVLREGEDLATH